MMRPMMRKVAFGVPAIALSAALACTMAGCGGTEGGQDGSGDNAPAGQTVNSVQTAEVADQLISGSHVQMVCVGQLDLAADALQILRRERALDSRLRADIHKHRRLNRTMRRCKFPAARMTVLANQLIHSLLAFLL